MIISPAIKITSATLLASLALVRTVFYDTLNERMDVLFFGVLGIAFLLLALPWERLRRFKAGGVEFSLDSPSISAAISGLNLDRLDNQALKSELSQLENQLKIARGSRVLWIDDKPHNILGARKVLRALDIHISTAISSEMATEILATDNDFDLIITDVQRLGDSYKLVEGGIKIHEGVNYVVAIRSSPEPYISKLPVIFYAAYDWDRLVKFTRPARELLPEAEISNTIKDFIPKVIRQLASERARPIEFNATKRATHVSRTPTAEDSTSLELES